MENVTELFEVVVQNRVSQGYRRAGFALQKGENQLHNVTAEQLAQIEADTRLAITHSAPMVTEGNQMLSKGLLQDDSGTKTQHNMGNEVLPADLTVEQLKSKLTALNVPFKASSNKPDLVALLEQTLNDGEK